MHKKEFRGLISSMLLGDAGMGLTRSKLRRDQPKHDLTNIGVYFYCNHSIKQEDYVLWKVDEINRVFAEKKLDQKCKIYRYDNGGFPSIKFVLHWTKYFRILYQKIYKIKLGSYSKQSDWLMKQIYNDKHLFIWFADDGVTMGNNKPGRPSLRLCINGFTFGEAELIRQWFFYTYGMDKPRIKRYIGKTGNATPFLEFGVDDSEHLWTRFGRYVENIPSMQHKFRGFVARYGYRSPTTS